MAVYSHSKLSAFEQCPLRYKYRYIDRKKPDIEKTIEAHLGITVHNTLEWLYHKVEKEKEIPNLENVINYYSNEWEKNFSEEIYFVKENLTPKDYFNKGVSFLVNYYSKYHPFDENTLELEKKIWVNLDQQGKYKLVGYIDRLVYNKETGKYEIHDYKTAGSLPTKEKIDADRQLALYSIGVKDELKIDSEVLLIWHYLAFNKKIVSRRTNLQLEELKKQTIKLIHQIESATEFPPKISILCKWCEFQKSCPYFDGKNF